MAQQPGPPRRIASPPALNLRGCGRRRPQSGRVRHRVRSDLVSAFCRPVGDLARPGTGVLGVRSRYDATGLGWTAGTLVRRRRSHHAARVVRRSVTGSSRAHLRSAGAGVVVERRSGRLRCPPLASCTHAAGRGPIQGVPPRAAGAVAARLRARLRLGAPRPRGAEPLPRAWRGPGAGQVANERPAGLCSRLHGCHRSCGRAAGANDRSVAGWPPGHTARRWPHSPRDPSGPNAARVAGRRCSPTCRVSRPRR